MARKQVQTGVDEAPKSGESQDSGAASGSRRGDPARDAAREDSERECRHNQDAGKQTGNDLNHTGPYSSYRHIKAECEEKCITRIFTHNGKAILSRLAVAGPPD